MKTVACIIARTSSSRLPEKVLREIKGKKLIEYIIEKAGHVRNLDAIYLCTSVDDNDKILLDVAERNGIKGYAGSRKSVISRMLEVADMENADNVVRITGDNIFTDEIFLERMIEEHNKEPKADYTRTTDLAFGVTAEVIRVSALKKCCAMMDPEKSEYLTLFIFRPDEFNCLTLVPEESLRTEFSSLTVDTPEDLERSEFIINKLYRQGRIYYNDIIRLNNESPIPHFKADRKMPVKLPDGKSITFEEFDKDMKGRAEKSRKVFLEDGFYENKRTF
jgi:spore coat polysaccharide biosynthesis protein SpsF